MSLICWFVGLQAVNSSRHVGQQQKRHDLQTWYLSSGWIDRPLLQISMTSSMLWLKEAVIGINPLGTSVPSSKLPWMVKGTVKCYPTPVPSASINSHKAKVLHDRVSVLRKRPSKQHWVLSAVCRWLTLVILQEDNCRDRQQNCSQVSLLLLSVEHQLTSRLTCAIIERSSIIRAPRSLMTDDELMVATVKSSGDRSSRCCFHLAMH